MSQIEELHDKAMNLAAQAMLQKANRLEDEAVELFKSALNYELSAYEALTNPVEPTRSVLLRSAATLALQCREIELAEKLAAKGLSGDAHPELADELRDVFEQANFNRHLQVRGVELGEDELQVSLSGQAVGKNLIEFRVLNSVLDPLSKLVHRVVERKSDRTFRTAGRVSRQISDCFGPYVSAGRPGSYALTLKLGSPKGYQSQLFVTAEDVLNEILDLMSLVENADQPGIEKFIPDPLYRNNFIALAKKIAPDGHNINHVGFTGTGNYGERVVSLSRTSLEFDVFDEKSAVINMDERVELTGILLYADATKEAKESIRIIDDADSTHHVTVPRELMADIVRPLWGLKVVVSGTKMGNQTTLTNIELAEE